MNQRTKKLLSEVKKDPWIAIEWKACHGNEALATEFIALIDDAIFEERTVEAIELAQIFRRLARRIKSRHITCQAEACLGSTFRLLGSYRIALDLLREAEHLAGSCDRCLGAICNRLAAVFAHQWEFGEALNQFEQALAHFQRADENKGISEALLGRSAVCRYLNRNTEGLENVTRAVDLMAPGMSPRYHIAAAVNAISLAAACDDRASYEQARCLVDQLREKLKGIPMNARACSILRWVRGLAFEKLGDIKNAVRCIESAISTLDRLHMLEEQKAAMADLARIRRKGKQVETNDRHILRLIEMTLRLESNEQVIQILERAKRDPSQENILAWRAALDARVPNLEVAPESAAAV